jgi:hypothetical protein
MSSPQPPRSSRCPGGIIVQTLGEFAFLRN